MERFVRLFNLSLQKKEKVRCDAWGKKSWAGMEKARV